MTNTQYVGLAGLALLILANQESAAGHKGPAIVLWLMTVGLVLADIWARYSA